MQNKRWLRLGSVIPLVLAILTSCAYSSKASKQLLEESLTMKYDMIVVPGVPPEDGIWSATMKDYFPLFIANPVILTPSMVTGFVMPPCKTELDSMLKFIIASAPRAAHCL